MEITIDEAIYCMKSYLPNDDYTHCTECKYYGCKDNKTCESSEAHQKAIEIMRKYQKIEEIVEHWACCGNPSDSMIAISEVLDNGNDD